MVYPLTAPQRAQQRHPFFQPRDPLPGGLPEGPELGLVPAADAGAQHGAAAGDVVQARPLDRQLHRMAQRKGRHADGAQPHAFSPRREVRQHDDGIEPGLVDEAVAHPDGFEGAGLLGQGGGREQVVHRREPEQDPAVGKAQAPSCRQITHRLSVCPIITREGVLILDTNARTDRVELSSYHGANRVGQS